MFSNRICASCKHRVTHGHGFDVTLKNTKLLEPSRLCRLTKVLPTSSINVVEATIRYSQCATCLTKSLKGFLLSDTFVHSCGEEVYILCKVCGLNQNQINVDSRPKVMSNFGNLTSTPIEVH